MAPAEEPPRPAPRRGWVAQKPPGYYTEGYDPKAARALLEREVSDSNASTRDREEWREWETTNGTFEDEMRAIFADGIIAFPYDVSPDDDGLNEYMVARYFSDVHTELADRMWAISPGRAIAWADTLEQQATRLANALGKAARLVLYDIEARRPFIARVRELEKQNAPVPLPPAGPPQPVTETLARLEKKHDEGFQLQKELLAVGKDIHAHVRGVPAVVAAAAAAEAAPLEWAMDVARRLDLTAADAKIHRAYLMHRSEPKAALALGMKRSTFRRRLQDLKEKLADANVPLLPPARPSEQPSRKSIDDYADTSPTSQAEPGQWTETADRVSTLEEKDL